MALLGAVEAGGTKFICAVAEQPDAPPIETISIPTTMPAETIDRALDFFSRHELRALGIASFGPIDLRVGSPSYGYITATPKAHWQNTDLVGPFQQAFNVPVGFDTDVNGAALGELRYGGGQGLDSLVYVTVGTGIGGGAITNGQVIHGLIHPEMGHIPVRRHPADTFVGACPYHADCLEGMASGPSLIARWGVAGDALPPTHQAWEFEAYYLAQAVCSMVYLLSPQRIILGGGVMHQRQLFEQIQHEVVQTLKGYIQADAITAHSDTYIMPPGLGDRSGAIGALELARLAG